MWAYIYPTQPNPHPPPSAWKWKWEWVCVAHRAHIHFHFHFHFHKGRQVDAAVGVRGFFGANKIRTTFKFSPRTVVTADRMCGN